MTNDVLFMYAVCDLPGCLPSHGTDPIQPSHQLSDPCCPDMSVSPCCESENHSIQLTDKKVGDVDAICRTHITHNWRENATTRSQETLDR